MARYDWTTRRNRGIHLTIRDIDCRDFDVDAMIAEFKRLHVTFFSFFAGGYVTTYPTRLEYQRISPWLDGRDLTGDIIATAHEHGIAAVPMIDLAMLPTHAYNAHPEWACRKPDGTPAMQAEDLYASCPMGGYVREYAREMVAELVARYDVDGMKFGGGSYGFSRQPCHCDACKCAYKDATGKQVPHARDWDSPAFRDYVRWRTRQTGATVRHLVDLCHVLRPGLPVMGNAVCFGDPHWTVGSSLDIEELASIQDAVQVEVQTRAWNAQPSGEAFWQYLRWPAESANYMTSVTEKPVWVVASYFYAWPWRRSAVPVAEQKAYLAQIAAHGASPMVNLSGGPPAVHEDRRGFEAMAHLYGFMAEHEELYNGDRSGAEVALVYDQNTLMYYGNDQAGTRVVEEIRGFEDALNRAHVPFDIVSTRSLLQHEQAPYRVLVLPNTAMLSGDCVAKLTAWQNSGLGVVASYESGMYERSGSRSKDDALGRLLGLSGRDESLPATGEHSMPHQVYMRQTATDQLPGCRQLPSLLPLGGSFVPVKAAADASVPLVRGAPFRLFPEGWSYPQGSEPGEPMLVTTDRAGQGRTAYFAASIGRCYWQSRYPDIAELIRGTVAWASRREPPLRTDAPPTVHTALRVKELRTMVHCINLTGGERLSDRTVPVHEINVGVRLGNETGIACRAVSSGAYLDVSLVDGFVWVTLPRLHDYEVLEFVPEG
ncbi:MAG: family 10 glycosylhydrolase [Chitinivibrionales bacterium]|nr:family 10 glycosylhydrolase [Chitinivibrionales bacterium]